MEAALSVVLDAWRVVVLSRSKLKDNPEPGLVVRVAVFLHPGSPLLKQLSECLSFSAGTHVRSRSVQKEE